MTLKKRGAFAIILLLWSASALAQPDARPDTQPDTQKDAQSTSQQQGNIMNPDISLDGLFSLAQFSRGDPLTFDTGHDPRRNGFNLQQVELTLGANVDPYLRLDSNIIFMGDAVEIEETYLTTLHFPGNLQLKGGQFFTAFGRNNPTHPHSWDFANKPLVLGRYFGGDGLRNLGLQVGWLTPLPWFSEIIVSSQNSTGGTALSFRPSQNQVDAARIPSAVQDMRSMSDAVYLARSNNFVSITDEFLFNFGGSYLDGANAYGPGFRTRIIGGDVYLKYRKLESLSFLGLQLEALKRSYGAPGENFKDWGWYAYLIYRLPEPFHRWHLGFRYDLAGPKNAPTIATGSGTDLDTARRWRYSPVVTFYPTEFSRLRFQYDNDQPQNFTKTQHALIFQFEALIGSHGAHKF